MLQPKRLGYVALDVADLEAAVRFYQDVIHLEVSLRSDGVAFLTGGREHHWLVLRQSDRPGFNRVAYEMEDEEQFDAISERIERAGVAVTRGGDLRTDRVERWMRCADPDGLTVELYTGMIELPVDPAYGHNVRLKKPLHAVLRVGDARKSYAFYSGLLGFQASDWVERHAVFLRCADRYHHSLALFGGAAQPALDHLCILVPTLDDVMRARVNTLALGVPLRNDMIRHGPSGSIGFYLKDEANQIAIEFCVDHRQVLDDAHRPRLLPAREDTLDVWNAVGPSGGLTIEAVRRLGGPSGDQTTVARVLGIGVNEGASK
jgi:catechol 2,3-dioxygenase-like lactoylglutathione lyase family enzyme